MLRVYLETSLEQKLGLNLWKLILSFDFTGYDNCFAVSLLLVSMFFNQVVKSLPNTTWVKRCLRRRYRCLESPAFLPSLEEWSVYFPLYRESISEIREDLKDIFFVEEIVLLTNDNIEMELLVSDFNKTDYNGFPFDDKKWDILVDQLEERGYKFCFFSYSPMHLDYHKRIKKLQSLDNTIYQFNFVGDSSIWVTWDTNKNKKRKV